VNKYLLLGFLYVIPVSIEILIRKVSIEILIRKIRKNTNIYN